MNRIAPLFVMFLLALACTRPAANVQQTVAAKQTGRRLEILFLGDNGHHRPIERVPAVMSALGSKGINFTYTDKLQDLNPENLAKYDAVLLYANWDTIAKPQEKALIDFVNNGKGLVAVHCASYCFRNSEELVKMMGGQFWRHTWDTIRPVWNRPDHPAIMGAKQFKTLDETYLHTKLQPDNLVLTEREIQPDQAKDKPNQKTEPYTWVRNYGKGRMFYTAYGHDENTWSQPEFMTMLEKGIRWAVGDEALKSLQTLNPQPFVYKDAKLPNYEKRSEPQVQQNALTPEESMKHIQVPADFNLNLFAAEPNVMHPIAMAWDERGRLYVLITKDYPNERKEAGGSDYILICEDTNADGKADKFTKFADGLSIPTGMVFANGGLIVSQAPHMLFLKDNDGDDKVDERKIMFSGWGTGDTHAGPSNLHYGFDNWIWGCVGYSGYKNKLAADKDTLRFGQAFFRFKPDGSKMEWMTTTSNNTWGMAFNESGDVFGSTANNSHGWYMAIPHRYFGASAGQSGVNGSRGTDTHKDMKTITPKVRQVDVFGGFTAAAGHNFYTARAFPKKYWNKIAFVAEPTGHVLHQNEMVKKGTDYEDKEAFNLMAGADEWFSPVFAQVGPDGAVWVADWYSFIIQHNPKPDGFKMGTGNAYETDLRDYTHGRIYQVSYKQAPKYEPIRLSKSRPDELVANLKNSNMLWRMHAQRLLVERGQKDVVPQLLEMLNDRNVDELGLNVGVIHALWTLKGLGVNLPANMLVGENNLLKHPSAAVRKNVVQTLPETPETAKALLNAYSLYDHDEVVALNTILKLTDIPFTPQVENAILSRLEQATETSDRWLPEAFAVALNAQNQTLLRKYLSKRAIVAMPAHDHSAMGHKKEEEMIPPRPSMISADDTPPIEGIDLAITNITIEPTSVSVREYTRVYLTIKNIGNQPLTKEQVPNVAVRIQGAGLSINFVSDKLNKGLAAGESIRLNEGNNGPWNANFGFSAEQSGKVTVRATIDADNKVKEADETKNNVLSKTFEVKGAAKFTDFALERAVRTMIPSSPIDSVLNLLKQSSQLDADARNAVLKAVVNGWNKKVTTLTEADKRFLATLKPNVPMELAGKYDNFLKLLNAQDASAIDPNLQVIKIKSVKEAMKFDVKEFTVKAGKPVELIFENVDAMQHNIVIGKPKSLEIIGKAADKMITQKDAMDKNYVPNLPQQIIAASPLVNSDQSYHLTFTAPAEAGNYVFVCTFPGHWSLMNGIMKVEK